MVTKEKVRVIPQYELPRWQLIVPWAKLPRSRGIVPRWRKILRLKRIILCLKTLRFSRKEAYYGTTLTEQSLDSLKSEGVPGDVLEKLESIKNRLIMGKEFSGKLKTTIGDEYTGKFESLILKHASTGDEYIVKFKSLILKHASTRILHQSVYEENNLPWYTFWRPVREEQSAPNDKDKQSVIYIPVVPIIMILVAFLLVFYLPHTLKGSIQIDKREGQIGYAKLTFEKAPKLGGEWNLVFCLRRKVNVWIQDYKEYKAGQRNYSFKFRLAVPPVPYKAPVFLVPGELEPEIIGRMLFDRGIIGRLTWTKEWPPEKLVTESPEPVDQREKSINWNFNFLLNPRKISLKVRLIFLSLFLSLYVCCVVLLGFYGD